MVRYGLNDVVNACQCVIFPSILVQSLKRLCKIAKQKMGKNKINKEII